jgi:hypothetical protein
MFRNQILALPGRLINRLRPVAKGRSVVLRDGSKVSIRQIRSTDAPLLADGFTRLSARSRQLRFLRSKPELSTAELRYLTDVDHHDHEALGALDHTDGRGVGIARYIRDAHDPRSAEIAVTVVDACWAGGWAPNCLLSWRRAPGPRASVASPRWWRPTMR